MFASRITAAVVLGLALAACADQPSAPASEPRPEPLALQQQDEEVVPGEILVKMKDGIPLDVLTPASGGLRLERRLAEPSRVAVLSVPRGQERAEAARMAADPRVEYAEPNYLRRINAIDPRLWAFYNPGGLTAYWSPVPPPPALPTPLPGTYGSVADMDIDAIENIAVGGAEVVIASLDTGVDTDHPEFAGKLILGWDWVNSDALPEDDNGHGTHTIGTMAGATVGVAGVTGAGTNVKVHVQKICNAAGTCPTSALVNAIYTAANYPGMVAMNLSVGGLTISVAEANAINYAVNTMGVLVIAAAGNNGSGTLACPACNVNTISVGALNWKGERTPFSQYGAGLDIMAFGGEGYTNTTPEMAIYSAWLAGGYKYMAGTSMAAPMVTGTAGVVASMTGITGAALRTRLLTTTDDLGAPGYDTQYGNGKLNTYRALTLTTLPYPL